MRRDLDKIWDELLLKAHGDRIDLVEKPVEQEKPAVKLFDWLKGSENIEPEMLKIAFIYPKTRESSSWVYAHELGRMYLEQKYGGKLQTVVFNNASTDSQVAQDISLAVASGCNVIFTTSPQMAAQSVKAAVENPQIRVFNCSVNVSYSSICTYYARTYEAKFLMGALAAAMCEGDELGYIADLRAGIQHQCLCPGSQNDQSQSQSTSDLVRSGKRQKQGGTGAGGNYLDFRR